MALFWRKNRRKRIVRRDTRRSMVRHVVIAVVIVSFFVAVVIGVWYLTRMPSLTISEINISGGETVSYDVMKNIVEQNLTGSYLLLVPKRFALTYPKEAIVESLTNVVRVHDVKVTKESNIKLNIVFSEYFPHALVCESEQESSPCYFLDKTGYLFSPAPPLRGGAFTRHVIDGLTLASGVQVFDENMVQSMDELIGMIEEAFQFRIVNILHSSVGDITYFINGGGKLITASDMTVQDIFANLQSILESDEFNHIAPGNFNYIDLRFGNKIFVNEELDIEEVIEDTSTSTESVSI